MTERVLFVDDEPNVLNGIKRHLRNRVVVETASSGEEGLRVIEELGPFAVIVSDMRMPQMNGSQFLARASEISPDSVRMILSGQSDLDNAISAVNEGNVFRFLTKPCTSEQLWKALETGFEQYRLLTIEKELLEKTLSGAVRMLTEILGLANPSAFSKAERIRRYSEELGGQLQIADLWEFRVAAMLSQIGCVTLPSDTLAKLEAGEELSADESKIYLEHPEVGGQLLTNIPRMEKVASMIAGQNISYTLSEMPEDILQWPPEAIGGTVLRCATELDTLRMRGLTHAASISALTEQSTTKFPKGLLDALDTLTSQGENIVSRSVSVGELNLGMILEADVLTQGGVRLLLSGQEITETILVRLRSAAVGVGVLEPIRVCIYIDQPTRENLVDKPG